ncbi:MAG TPA: hypothetical protein ENI75_02990, partial [Mizugakiibacter sp.]|nr:hypothetical protein [Mizugakiibacter sp.]
MIHLIVSIRLPDGDSVIVGDLAVADPDANRGALRGEFRYRQSYLDDPRAFSIDPEHLPLAPGIFEANRPRAGVPAVFEDSLPDDWGRELLVRKYQLARDEQRVPVFLRLIGVNGLGALRYEDASPHRGRPAAPGVVARRRTAPRQDLAALRRRSAAVSDLPALNAAARRALQGGEDRRPAGGNPLAGGDSRNDLDLLFRAGSSPGGARPKVLIH